MYYDIERYPENTKTVAVASLYGKMKFLFCLPGRGGETYVYYFGRIDLACKFDNCFVNLRRTHK